MPMIRILVVPDAGVMPKAGEVTAMFRGAGATPSQYLVPPEAPLPKVTDLATALEGLYTPAERAALAAELMVGLHGTGQASPLRAIDC
jgi:hypothetical protein